MELSEKQKRVVEIKKTLLSEYAGDHTMCPIDFSGKEERLRSELDIIESQERFELSNKQIALGNRQTKISFWGTVFTVVVGVAAIISSVLIPVHERIQNKHDQVEAVYKNLITNQDIFISNSNEARKLLGSNNISNLPEFYIEDKTSDNVRKVLQNTFGLVQYRFFLYYLQQTDLMNEEIKQIRTEFIGKNTKSFAELPTTRKYLATVEYLILDEKEEPDTKLDYQKDTECIQYFFEQSFSYITIDGRGTAPVCSNESLNRIYNHFGYLNDDTPVWLKPLMRNALDSRGNGLGSRIIEI